MADYLEDWSPFQTSLGRFMNMARIGLGEDRGYFELHQHGELALYSTQDPSEPIFTFNPEDAKLLIAAAQELATMGEAWKAHRERSDQPHVQDLNNSKRTAEPSAERSGPVRAEMPAAIVMKNGNANGHQRALELAGD